MADLLRGMLHYHNSWSKVNVQSGISYNHIAWIGKTIWIAREIIQS